MTLWLYVGAVIGCGAGAVLRHLVAIWVPQGRLAWHTVAANTAASALVGALAGMTDVHPGWSLVLGAGLGGGLSTFSTLAVDAARTWESGQRRRAVAYLVVTGVCGLVAAWCGWSMTS